MSCNICGATVSMCLHEQIESVIRQMNNKIEEIKNNPDYIDPFKLKAELAKRQERVSASEPIDGMSIKDHRISELEAESAEKNKCLSELEDEIIRLQGLIDNVSSAGNKRIAELEAELVQLRAAFAKRKVEFLTIEHDLIDVDVIKRLEAELAALQLRTHKYASTPEARVRSVIEENARLRECLKKIEMHPHIKDGALCVPIRDYESDQSYYADGCVEGCEIGHRHCAEIARGELKEDK